MNSLRRSTRDLVSDPKVPLAADTVFSCISSLFQVVQQPNSVSWDNTNIFFFAHPGFLLGFSEDSDTNPAK